MAMLISGKISSGRVQRIENLSVLAGRLLVRGLPSFVTTTRTAYPFHRETKIVLAVLNFAGMDDIRVVELCLYADNLNRIAFLNIRFISLRELNRGNMHLVDLVVNPDPEVPVHAACHGANAVVHFIDNTL